MNQTIKEQILAVRDTGRTNMFDIVAVQRIAYEMELFDLVIYLEGDHSEYVHFIMTGKD